MTIAKPDRPGKISIGGFDFAALLVLSAFFAFIGGLVIWRANDPTDYLGAALWLGLACFLIYRLLQRYRI